jgi:hypothetical protein
MTADRCVELVVNIVSAIPRGPSIQDIAKKVVEQGLATDERYVAAIAKTDPRLLLTSENKIFLIDHLLPNFTIVATALSRSSYLVLQHAYRLAISGSFETRLVDAPTVRQNVLNQAFPALLTQTKSPSVESYAVGAKLVSRSLQTIERPVQGIAAALHAAIVQCLLDSRHAMTLLQLEQRIGTTIPLSPETLPPGRIMAYSRHPRFLKPENAFYVLQDWVETDREKRGRIPRDRIITPFIHKEWRFSPKQLVVAVESSELHRLCGLVSIAALIDKLSEQFSLRPTEPYFKSKMRDRAEQMLQQEGWVPLGRGFYGDSAVIRERAEDESIDEWRVDVLLSALGWPKDFGRYLMSLEDPIVRSQLKAAASGTGLRR